MVDKLEGRLCSYIDGETWDPPTSPFLTPVTNPTFSIDLENILRRGRPDTIGKPP